MITMEMKGEIILVVVLIVSNLIIYPSEANQIPSPLSYETVTINGTSELVNSDLFIGGSGVSTDPYIIDNQEYDTLGLAISNIEGVLIVRNFSFETKTNTSALEIVNISTCILENISISKRPHLIQATGETHLIIKNSTFSDIPTRYEYIWNSYTTPIGISIDKELHVENSSFYGTYNGTENDQNILQGSKITITTCLFNLTNVGVYAERGIYNINNCTLYNSSGIELNDYVQPASSFSVYNNLFNCSKLEVGLVNGADISNNRFEGIGSKLHIGRSFPIMSNVRNNSFDNSSGLGVYASYNTMNYYFITENIFSNCPDGAILLSRSSVNEVYIWKNHFYFNRNTGQNFSYPQVSVKGTTHAGYHDVYWHRNCLGNFWTDWTGPDDDNDGIVDDPYIIQNRTIYPTYEDITDEYPLTNSIFDIIRPNIRIIQPISSDQIDQEYIKVTWLSWDEGSGVDKEFISLDNETWTDVTNQNWWSLKLIQGQNSIYMKVYDRAGLYNWTSVSIEVIDINGPLEIIKPEDGQYFQNRNITIEWWINEDFTIKNQSILIDGIETDLEINEREKELSLDEGSHDLKIYMMDVKNCVINDEIKFFVDLTPPLINVISPEAETDYSNKLIRFKWNVIDDLGIRYIQYRINKGYWTNLSNYCQGEMDVLLGKGEHAFEIKAEDLAGWISIKEVSFSIGKSGMVNIIRPINGTVTHHDQIIIEWTFSGSMEIEKTLLFEKRGNEQINVTSLNSYTMDLELEGSYEFVIRYIDSHSNYFEGSVFIFKDTTVPNLRILNKSEYVNLSPMVIRWYNYDLYGISNLSYQLNNNEWNEISNNGHMTLLDLREGKHIFRLKCYDRAGNMMEDEYSFIYDVTSPELMIKDPIGNTVLGDAIQVMTWDVVDEYPIETQIIMINGIDRDVGATIRQKEFVFPDGHNEVEVIAFDLAGNYGSTTINFFIDMERPIVEWVSSPSHFSNNSIIDLKWNASDNFGINVTYLLINGDRIELEMGRSHYVLNLVEGEHEIQLHVIDQVGLTDFLINELIVDLSNPYIDLILIANDDIITIGWNIFDNISGVNKITFTYGNTYLNSQSINARFNVERSSDCDLIIISISDLAGNHITIEKRVPPVEEVENRKENRTNSIIIFILVSLVLVSLGIGIFIFIRKLKNVNMEEKIQNPPTHPEISSIEKRLSGAVSPTITANQLNRARKTPTLPSVGINETDTTLHEKNQYRSLSE